VLFFISDLTLILLKFAINLVAQVCAWSSKLGWVKHHILKGL